MVHPLRRAKHEHTHTPSPYRPFLDPPGKFEEGGVASMLSDGRADGGGQGGSGERKPGAIPPPVTATHFRWRLVALPRPARCRMLHTAVPPLNACTSCFVFRVQRLLHVYYGKVYRQRRQQIGITKEQMEKRFTCLFGVCIFLCCIQRCLAPPTPSFLGVGVVVR